MGKAFGAVLVVDGSAGSGAGKVSLCVNGKLTTQEGTITGVTILPLGSKGGSIEGFDFGIGAVANGYGGTLQGASTQVKIYDTALTDTLAADLSLAIAEPSKVNR